MSISMIYWPIIIIINMIIIILFTYLTVGVKVCKVKVLLNCIIVIEECCVVLVHLFICCMRMVLSFL